MPFWIYGAFFRLFGSELGVARAVAVALGIQAALFVWLAARWLGANRAGALLAGLIAALFPWSVWLGAAPLPESPAAALVLLGLAALGSELPYRRLPGAIAVAAACLCRYEAWPVALMFAIFSLGDARSKRDRFALTSALIALAPIAAWLAHGAARHGDPLFFWKRVAGYRQALGGGASLFERLGTIPFSFVREEPGLVLLLIVLVPALGAWKRYRRPLLAIALLVLFLIAGELGGGGPTHHGARALMPAWYLACVMTGDALGRRLSGPFSGKSSIWLFLPALALAASWLSHGATPRDFVDRRTALEIGTRARELGAEALLIDTPDYAHLAVTAAFGRPNHAEPLDDHDPRKPRPPDVFASETALRRALGGGARRWLVASRLHARVAARVGAVRAQNSAYLLVEPSP